MGTESPLPDPTGHSKTQDMNLGRGGFTGDHLGNLANTQFTCQFPTGNQKTSGPHSLMPFLKVFSFFFIVVPVVVVGCLTLPS